MSDEFNWDMDMDEALDLDFAGWQPEPGDKVIGTVLQVTESEPGTWGTYPIYTIATRDGGISVHAFHTVLKKAMSHVVPGDFVGIKYKGKVQGANQTYEDYNVIARHATGGLTGGGSPGALPAPESPALPAQGAGSTRTPNEAQEAAPAAEQGSWPEGNGPASLNQRAAINRLRAARGMEPLDWSLSEMTEEQAAIEIESLQATPV